MEQINYTMVEDSQCVLVKIQKSTHKLVVDLVKIIGVSGDSILSIALQEALKKEQRRK